MLKVSEIASTFAKSVISRIGTAFAVWLLAYGVPDDLVEQLVQAFAVVISLVLDVGLVLLFRGKVR